MQVVGETFKKQREGAGLDLKGVSSRLRIRAEFLKALEEHDFEKLPPPVYTKGYIREYAELLDMDPAPLLESYAAYIMPKTEVHKDLPVPKKKSLPSITVLVLVMLLVLGGVALISFLRATPPQRDNRIPELLTPSMVSQESKPPEIAGSPSDGERDKLPSPNQPEQYLLRVTATETTWLSVEGDSGKPEEALMKPGESREWTAQKRFTLKIGNAGGVRLVLNEKDMGTLGRHGEVVRTKLPREEPEATVTNR